MDRLCWVCQQRATMRCAKCQRPLCRAHELLGLNERLERESLCPECAEVRHQERHHKRGQ